MTDCCCAVTLCVARYASPYWRNTSASVGEVGCGDELSEFSARYGPVGGTDVDISILLVKARMFFSSRNETPEKKDRHVLEYVKKNPIKREIYCEIMEECAQSRKGGDTPGSDGNGGEPSFLPEASSNDLG